MLLDKTTFAREHYNKTAPFYNFMEWQPVLFVYKKWCNDFFRQVAGPRVPKIGVGASRNIKHYPSRFQFFGIDLSEGMLQMDAERPFNAGRTCVAGKTNIAPAVSKVKQLCLQTNGR